MKRTILVSATFILAQFTSVQKAFSNDLSGILTVNSIEDVNLMVQKTTDGEIFLYLDLKNNSNLVSFNLNPAADLFPNSSISRDNLTLSLMFGSPSQYSQEINFESIYLKREFNGDTQQKINLTKYSANLFEKMKNYYPNKQIYKDKSSVWRNSERDKFNDYLNTLSCIDCGESDPIVLEFDHQVDKKFNISRGAGTMSFDKLMNEISKCEVVCANCHRKRTAKTFGWRKGRLV